MNALIVGDNNTLRQLIATELTMHHYEVALSNSRTQLPDRHFDLCVDLSATGIQDVRALVVNNASNMDHYILMSSCEVYPATPQLAPWQVDKIDLNDDTGFGAIDRRVRGHRAAERELQHLGKQNVPWSILRPAIVETKETPDQDVMGWFVSRILDGGPLVLPDGDDPLFRHVSGVDLARAVTAIAGKKDAYFQTLHVTSPALLSYESYARLIMRCLNKTVPIVRVSALRWSSANLGLPLGKQVHSAFIDESPLLHTLGWESSDENEWVREHAESLGENPLEEPPQRARELALHNSSTAILADPLSQAPSGTWCLVGEAGKPYSLRMENQRREKRVVDPLLKTLKLSTGQAEERFLLEPSADTNPRIMGHTALLELLEPGRSGLQRGTLFLPLGQCPCGVHCVRCDNQQPGLSGVSYDGFGQKYSSLPLQHLVPLPTELADIALLAYPLACMLSVLPSLINDCKGTLWVYGERVEAALALLLARDMGRSVVHIGRTRLEASQIPGNVPSLTLQQALDGVRKKSVDAPGLIINCSGARDGENMLAKALSREGYLLSPFSATQLHRSRVDVRYPLVAPGRLWLERSIQKLSDWRTKYELDALLQPLALACYQELFIAAPFKQSFIDIAEPAQ